MKEIQEYRFKSSIKLFNFLYGLQIVKTMYKYVKKILPNSLIEINLSDLKMKNEKYFHFPNTNQYYNLSEKDWINKLDLCLQKAVKRQLISDVPIGFCRED